MRQMLRRQLDRGREHRERALRQAREAAALPGDATQAAWSTAVEGRPVKLVLPDSDVRESQEAAYNLLNSRSMLQAAGRVDGAARLFVARGRTITQLDAQGKTLRSMKTDAPVQALHWWPEAAEAVGRPLLLAGLRNETVVAFTPPGERAWTFQSEMAPEVIRSGQTQWFSSALPGIFGLGSGPFMDGDEQAFVGSATTLEVLNPDGTLATRQPAFWGSPTVFQVIEGPEGRRKLLVGRNPTGKMRLAIFDSETLERSSGFDGVPEGHTFVNPWGQIARRHIFYEDMDGDGTREVVSELNGTWNRVSIWDADGTPLYNANFGPGRPIPYANIRDLDVADLDGNGTKEVLVGTDDSWLVALDHRLEKKWARRLTSRPMVLAAVPSVGSSGRHIVVGCKDGTILAFGPDGHLLWHGRVAGTPEQIDVLNTANGSMVVIATNTGQVAGFSVP